MCTAEIFLSALTASTNLVELQLDNSTICLPWSDCEHPWYFENIDEGGGYPYNIFQNLDNCIQLTKFSCRNCQVQWHSDTEVVPAVHLLPGQFCSQWLIRSAPLSLQFFNGPIYEYDLPLVLERYHVANSFMNALLDRPPLQVIPNPTDIYNYFDGR